MEPKVYPSFERTLSSSDLVPSAVLKAVDEGLGSDGDVVEVLRRLTKLVDGEQFILRILFEHNFIVSQNHAAELLVQSTPFSLQLLLRKCAREHRHYTRQRLSTSPSGLHQPRQPLRRSSAVQQPA